MVAVSVCSAQFFLVEVAVVEVEAVVLVVVLVVAAFWFV